MSGWSGGAGVAWPEPDCCDYSHYAEDSNRGSGGGACFGVGLVYFISRDFAFTFNARADAINWNQASGAVTLPGGGVLTVDQPVDEGGLAAKFGVGMGWWF